MLVAMGVLIVAQFNLVEDVTTQILFMTMLLLHSTIIIRKTQFQIAVILEELQLLPALIQVCYEFL